MLCSMAVATHSLFAPSSPTQTVNSMPLQLTIFTANGLTVTHCHLRSAIRRSRLLDNPFWVGFRIQQQLLRRHQLQFQLQLEHDQLVRERERNGVLAERIRQAAVTYDHLDQRFVQVSARAAASLDEANQLRLQLQQQVAQPAAVNPPAAVAQVRCSICWDYCSPNKPFEALAPCGHMFCVTCLATLFENDAAADRDTFCPSCRTQVDTGSRLRLYPDLEWSSHAQLHSQLQTRLHAQLSNHNKSNSIPFPSILLSLLCLFIFLHFCFLFLCAICQLLKFLFIFELFGHFCAFLSSFCSLFCSCFVWLLSDVRCHLLFLAARCVACSNYVLFPFFNSVNIIPIHLPFIH